MNDPKLVVPEEILANDLATQASKAVEKISNQTKTDYAVLLEVTSADLGSARSVPETKNVEQEMAVQNLIKIFGSASGLIAMTRSMKVLMDITTNNRTANQFLAFAKEGKDANTIGAIVTKAGLTWDRITAAVRQSRIKEYRDWRSISASVVSGTDMKNLARLLKGTPGEAVMEVFKDSIENSKILQAMADDLGRQADGLIRKINLNDDKVSTLSKEAVGRLTSFEDIRKHYLEYKSKLNAMEPIEPITDQNTPNFSAKKAQYENYCKLVESERKTFEKFNKLFDEIQADSRSLEGTRVSTQCAMQLAESMKVNQARLMDLADQFMLTALWRVLQVMLAVSAASVLYSSRLSAWNRSEQLKIRNNCQSMMGLVIEGKLNEVLAFVNGEKPEMDIIPA
jgi:hypothetical protein